MNFLLGFYYFPTGVMCDNLSDITNGSVVLSGTNVGSTATYNCENGYFLVGMEQRQCQNNGQWNGTEPYCKRKLSIKMIVVCLSANITCHNILT